MIYPRITLAITTALSIAACSPSGNPHLDMCKKITGNLLFGDTEYGEIKEVKGRDSMQLTLPYTNDGQSSEAVCTFPTEGNSFDNKDISPNDIRYQTAPKAMTVDGMPITGEQLIKASLASSKEVLADTAQETKKQTAEAAEEAKVLAGEAKDKATEMASEAKDKAAVLADEAKVKAGEMATKIQESEALERAKGLAEDAKGKATSALIDGAKKLQEKLEN